MASDLPHVTAIIKAAGLIDSAWFTQADLDRGTAVHQATHYLDDGDLDWSTVDPVVLPRLRQYQRFKEEVNPEITAIEQAVTNEAVRYCGRFDRLVRINGREGILDIKGPARAAWQSLQLAAYAGCFARSLARWTLHLADDGYRLVEHKDRNDWEVFKAAVTLAAWRTKHAV